MPRPAAERDAGRAQDDPWCPASDSDFFAFEPVFVLPERRWDRRRQRRWLGAAILVVFLTGLGAIPLHDRGAVSDPAAIVPSAAATG